jgi:hypothetical protein
VTRPKRKSRWTLRHLKIEVNLLIAKVGFLFSKEEPPKRTPRARVRKAQQIARAEYRNIQAEAPRDIRPYVVRATPVRRPPAAPYYSAFGVDANGLPTNILGDTVLALTGGVRVKAIREGDIGTAIAAAIVEQVVLDTARKSTNQPAKGPYW